MDKVTLKKQDLVDSILNVELDQFLSVTADDIYSCQQSPDSFLLYRKAQFDTWDEATLESYLDDLHKATEAGVNLMTVKYAYMDGQLEITQDSYYLYAIVEQLFQWQISLFDQYPILKKDSRPLDEDSKDSTSFKTYLTAELCTYSEKTLLRLYEHIQQMVADSQNMSEMIYHNTLKSYGYSSLEDYLTSHTG